MPLIKKHTAQVVEELPTFTSLEQAEVYFQEAKESDQIAYAIEEISKFYGGVDFFITYIQKEDADKNTCTKIASVISSMDPDNAPIEKIMDLLKLENAYARGLGISILRNYGNAIKYYIVKFLIGDDRDLRIFAINVLGDVNFSESRDMLVELLEKEQDLNVAMTAVDYMGEIGEMDDIPLLESLKSRFPGDVYAEFAIDTAVKSIRG